METFVVTNDSYEQCKRSKLFLDLTVQMAVEDGNPDVRFLKNIDDGRVVSIKILNHKFK